jgi:hypothetical protein
MCGNDLLLIDHNQLLIDNSEKGIQHILPGHVCEGTLAKERTSMHTSMHDHSLFAHGLHPFCSQMTNPQRHNGGWREVGGNGARGRLTRNCRAFTALAHAPARSAGIAPRCRGKHLALCLEILRAFLLQR